MKTLKKYIIEAVEEVPDEDIKDYVTVTLVKRTDIKCSELSKEDFISLFSEDYKNAIKESNALLDKEHEESKAERVERVKAQAEEYANSHYKRDSMKKKYIDNAVANETSKAREKWWDVKYFDFDLYFGRKNYINNDWIISDDNLDKLGKVYDFLTTDEYAKKFWDDATGWAFKYTHPKGSYRNAFRPWINLIVSDTKREEIKQNKEHLADSIQKFYSGSNYWGD